jgi:hypothetical protein
VLGTPFLMAIKIALQCLQALQGIFFVLAGLAFEQNIYNDGQL